MKSHQTTQVTQVKNQQTVSDVLWQVSDKALDILITKALQKEVSKVTPPQNAWETLKTQINTGSP